MEFTVLHVEPKADFTMIITFEGGVKKFFDFKPYLEYRPFVKLQDPKLFMEARAALGTVVWDSHTDIAPEELYEKGILLDSKQGNVV